jgi:arsenate reductase
LGEAKLRELVKKMNVSPRQLLRTGEAVYRELGLAQREVSDEELIALMVEHPELLQRPIVERGARAVLARPVENVRALLEDV